MAQTITKSHPEITTIFGIPVTIEYDEYYTVIDNEINIFGVGDTIAEAEEDYKSVVLSYFEDLEENESRLADNLKEHLFYLREKLADYITR
jgi:predicted RNase H-like HicB family nuclease